MKRKGTKVLVIILCIVSVLAILTAGNGYVYNFVTGFIITPLQYVATGAVSSAGDSMTPHKSRAELEKENSRLTEENNRLNDLLVDYYDIKKEYDELAKFYDIKKEQKNFSLAVANVIARDPNENFYGFTLDRGITDQIPLNAPVITDKGLVGWVSEVSINSCKVTTILSPATNAAALDKKTSDNGIITGSAEFSDKGLTCLTNIQSKHHMEKDDIIVTSGFGGVYPENIKIGKVTEITVDSYTGMPIAVIEPFEDISHISSVVIIKDFNESGK